MGAAVKRIVISGYYGFANSGDEAVLQSILLALREEGNRLGLRIEPVVLSADPQATEAMYGVRSVHRLKLTHIVKALRESDGLISGGGSLLQDVTGLGSIPYYTGIMTIARLFRKPVFIYAQGIGPVNRPFFYPWIRRIFSGSRYVSVRDRESASLLETMGVPRGNIRVVPDPVMGLPGGSFAGAPSSVREHPVVGVSVRFWNEDRSELEALAAALNDIRAQRKAEIRFLPFHLPHDTEASRYVMAKMNVSPEDPFVRVEENAAHPQEMLALVASCDLLIGMRLHSLIYAASQYVPMVGISYDPKIDRFLHRLDMSAAASTGSFSREAVVFAALRLLDNPEAWREEKRTLIEALKREAREPARQIALFLAKEG